MQLFLPSYDPVEREAKRAALAAYRASKEAIPSGYDVFLIAGQSNTYGGTCSTGDTCPNGTLDSTDPDILQWGRHNGNNNTVILAQEPLDHVGYQGSPPDSDHIGWVLTFAKMYKEQGLLLGDRKILLVPTAEGGTGFGDNRWNPGDTNYVDAVTRTNAALSEGEGTNALMGILWHQGEDEGSTSELATAHEAKLLAMIDALRVEFGPFVPFVAGGLLPATFSTGFYEQVNDNIKGIVTSRTFTGFADPEIPTELTAEGVGSVSNNHYSSYSMRGSSQNFSDPTTLGMAGRYWTAYLSALTNI